MAKILSVCLSVCLPLCLSVCMYVCLDAGYLVLISVGHALLAKLQEFNRPEDPPPPPPPPQPPAPSTSMRTMDQTSGLGTSLELTLPTHNPLPPPPNPPPAPITQLPTPRPTTLTTDPSSPLYLENLFGSPSLSINTIPDTPPSQYPKSPVIDANVPLSLHSAGIIINQQHPPSMSNQQDILTTNHQPSTTAVSHQVQPPKDITIPTILNLSSHQLTDGQTRALELGLKFVPSPKELPDPLEFFQDFRQRCGWTFKRVTGAATGVLPKAIEERVDIMRDNLASLQFSHHRPPNIPDDIRLAINHLKQNKDLVIREADKGSCIVIQDKSSYISEGKQHLSDDSTYRRTSNNKTVWIAHKANWALRHHKHVGQLSSHLHNKLKVDVKTVRTQELYFLRKVHKSPHGLRPICSGSSGPTEKLSGYICSKLTPHLEDITSLVSNSQQVVLAVEKLDLSANKDAP